MKLSHGLIVITGFAVLALAQALHAQSVTGTIMAIDHNSYAGVASQFRIDSLKVGGETIYNGRGYLFCADIVGKSIDEDPGSYPRTAPNLTLGTLDQMEIWNRFGNTQDEALARASAYWFIDNFYESEFINPADNASARQYAFQNVVWEIFGDAGTSNGLNFSNGNINRAKFSPSGISSNPALWGYMNTYLQAVQNSGVTSGYTSKYEVLVALDPRSSHQDYLLLAANPSLMVVPEPSSAGIAMLGGLLLLARRRR